MPQARHKRGDRAGQAELPAWLAALQLIRKRELAKLLGVNAWTIDHWRKRGLIPPPVVLSPQILGWRRADIELWLAQRQQQPAKTRVVRREAGRG